MRNETTSTCIDINHAQPGMAHFGASGLLRLATHSGTRSIEKRESLSHTQDSGTPYRLIVPWTRPSTLKVAWQKFHSFRTAQSSWKSNEELCFQIDISIFDLCFKLNLFLSDKTRSNTALMHAKHTPASRIKQYIPQSAKASPFYSRTLKHQYAGRGREEPLACRSELSGFSINF